MSDQLAAQTPLPDTGFNQPTGASGERPDY